MHRVERITGKSSPFQFDVCDYERMESLFSKYAFDCVIHFAALKSNADSIENPGLYLNNNLESTFVLLNLMTKYGVKYIVFSSSATVYGNCKNVPTIENEPIDDVISSYGFSKY